MKVFMEDSTLNESNIKKEGMTGLLYSRVENGNYIHANAATKGQKCFCPFCGCAMHPTKSKSGLRFFARNSGAVHTDPICIDLESKKVHHSFEGLKPYELITSLCHVAPRGGNPVGGGPGTPGPGGNGYGDPDAEIKTRPFASLKQIYEAGIYYLDPDDMQGDHKVSDFIITFKYGKQFFTSPGFHLGARIVMARYDGFDSATRSITFSQFSKGDYLVKFRLVFTNNSEFRKIRDKFAHFTEDEITGKTVLVKRHTVQDVLIASDSWELISRDNCPRLCSSSTRCQNCCGMYQAVITNTKQLYLIPSDR